LSPPRRLALFGFALAGALASAHCQRGAEAPAATAAADCCEVTPNAALAAGVGRVVVSYPEGGHATRLDLFAASDASTAIQSKYGDVALELPPGTYDATVGGRRVAGVEVQAGRDTRIRVGVLHVHAGDGTRIDIFEPADGEKLADGYGEKQYGLAVGLVAVEIAGQRDTALIEDGKITEF
jgi:hypothetical protein